MSKVTSTIVTAIVGALSTVVAAGFAAWSTLKQRRVDINVEHVKLNYEAMGDLLDQYKEDNEDLRRRLVETEAKLAMISTRMSRCESEKACLESKVDEGLYQIRQLKQRLGER